MKNTDLFIPEEYPDDIKCALNNYYKKQGYNNSFSGTTKLELGNEIQLVMLKDISLREAALLEEYEDNGELAKKTYKVIIEFSGTYEDEVEAYNEDEAKELAQENMDISDADIDIERTDCEEI